MNTIKSVWKKVAIAGPDECWNWLGGLSNGYGRIDISGVPGVYAHRVAYLSANPGSITLCDDGTKEKCVLHRCDNTRCCNPSHLFLGSHAENMKDKQQKGRSKIWACSTESPRAKLSKEDIFFIRIQKKYGATLNALALLYDVHRSTISSVMYGRTYKDVE